MLLLFCSGISYATPIPYQGNWRWRNDDGDVYSATWKDSMNTPVIINANEKIRLRTTLFDLDSSSYISLQYSQWPGVVPWTKINNIDTGKFFISSSNYLVNTKSYSDNQLLSHTYSKTITFDSTNSYYLAGNSNLDYELEYSISSTSKIQPGAAYFFSLLQGNNALSIKSNFEYPVLLTLPINWSTLHSNTNEQLKDICFVDANNGWVVGSNNKILKTTNGGLTWTSKTTELRELRRVYFININYGWACGRDSSIIKTTDGGNTWISKMVGDLIDCVFFINKDIGWAAGWSIYKTNDGGETWSIQSSEDFALNDIFFTDENNGVAVGGSVYQYGDYGSLVRTTNGGDTWIPQLDEYGGYLLNDLHQLNGVFFIDANNGWAVGGTQIQLVQGKYVETDLILKTTDGGKTWIDKPSGTPHALYSVYFTDANNGWAVGGYGTVLKTTNGGENWMLQTSGTSIQLNAIFFAGNKNGIIVGNNGKILRTTNGSETSVPDNQEDKVPSHFLLSQNYPNPFNPSTKIKYSIPIVETMHASSLQLVQLKVYDILGREVATLVNETEAPGNYEVNFNASNLASGVYFYRLKAGNYISTKKLILLK